LNPGIPNPYATPWIPGVGGVVKEELDDFLVHEVPLYEPSGAGEHVFFEIEKRDLTTLEAVERIGSALGVPSREFGFAGMKDRKGVTRQWLTVRGGEVERVLGLELPQLRVLAVALHGNKLRLGHLRGNRFEIRVRDVEPDRERIGAVLEYLAVHGVPNYFGPQRFGLRGEAQWIGRALVEGRSREAVYRLLGAPSPEENNPDLVAARYLFLQYRWAEARERLPPTFRDERRVLDHLLRRGEDFPGAIRRLHENMARIYLSAFQSHLFNSVLERRAAEFGGDLGRLSSGDLAFLHRNGAVFAVESLEGLDARARSFEISPSGPLFGPSMPRPAEGVAARIESEVLESEGVTNETFENSVPVSQLSGGRRPLRVPVADLDWELDGNDLRLRFFLPRGSFATSLLRELSKNDGVPSGFFSRARLPNNGYG
jgi:tRNA pseudouridine13 synthase